MDYRSTSLGKTYVQIKKISNLVINSPAIEAAVFDKEFFSDYAVKAKEEVKRRDELIGKKAPIISWPFLMGKRLNWLT
jgi:hypothetical protein